MLHSASLPLCRGSKHLWLEAQELGLLSVFFVFLEGSNPGLSIKHNKILLRLKNSNKTGYSIEFDKAQQISDQTCSKFSLISIPPITLAYPLPLPAHQKKHIHLHIKKCIYMWIPDSWSKHVTLNTWTRINTGMYMYPLVASVTNLWE